MLFYTPLGGKHGNRILLTTLDTSDFSHFLANHSKEGIHLEVLFSYTTTKAYGGQKATVLKHVRGVRTKKGALFRAEEGAVTRNNGRKWSRGKCRQCQDNISHMVQ